MKGIVEHKSGLIEIDQYIAPDGQTYTFHNGVDSFLMSFEGTGMPEIEYMEQRGPYQHGTTIYDFRLNPRTIQYVTKRKVCDRFSFWDARTELLNALRPNRQTSGTFGLGKLRKKFMDGSIRDIDVLIKQGPRFGARDMAVWEETVITESLIFYAPDPTFYDPTQICLQWTLAAYNHWILPFSFIYNGAGSDLVFGSNIINDSLNVVYAGSWLTYPTIVITGPLSGPTVYNVTTGEKIKLVYNVGTGEIITISLAYGNKTVTNNLGANLIGTVTSDSDLATFHIAPAPEAAGGVNTLRIYGHNAVVGTTDIQIAYYTRYIGI
jgi:hypothetical protein